jgi:hypothetical protein
MTRLAKGGSVGWDARMICQAKAFWRVGRPGGAPPGNPVTKGFCRGGTLRTSPAGTGERRLEEGHGSAVPPTDKWCVHPWAMTRLTSGVRCVIIQPAGAKVHYHKWVKCQAARRR